MMKMLRTVAPALGVACLLIGSLAAVNDGGTVAALGHSLITAGAIIIAAASSAWRLRRAAGKNDWRRHLTCLSVG